MKSISWILTLFRLVQAGYPGRGAGRNSRVDRMLLPPGVFVDWFSSERLLLKPKPVISAASVGRSKTGIFTIHEKCGIDA